MGRKSSASLSVLPVTPIKRIAQPDGLTDAESALWGRVVGSKPAEWFGEDAAPLLHEYVRAAVMCGVLDVMVKAAIAGGDAGELAQSIKLRDMEAKRAMSIGTKLRLTPQSRYTPQAASTANKKAAGARPWQT